MAGEIMDFSRILDDIYQMPASAKDILMGLVTEVHYNRGHILLKADKIEDDILFVKKGIVRAYVLKDEQEVTFWFGLEGQPVLSMRSYVEDKPGYENIVLLEDSSFYKLSREKLEALFKDNPDIANWGRRLAEQELLRTEERLINREFKAARERYRDLLSNHPELIQRVKLGHIASYLGITQVSLSRIRAEIR